MAGATLLAHALAVWLMIQVRVAPESDNPAVPPVMMTVVDSPAAVDVSEGPVPIQVDLVNVIRLERLAPPIVGPPIEVPEPPAPADTTELTATAIDPGESSRGIAGTDSQSSGPPGGGLQVRLLQRVNPRYPAAARARQEQGATGVKVKVSRNGRVSNVQVTKSSGSRSLDAAALEAVRRWRFAPLPPGLPSDTFEFVTEMRFVLYAFKYSRLGEGAADALGEEYTKTGVPDEMTPGSQQALQEFITEVGTGSYLGESDKSTQVEIAKMRVALAKWGEVKAIRFTGMPSPTRWMSYAAGPVVHGKRTAVEVSWNNFEIQHDNAKSTWLVAIGRDGSVWDARATVAPW